jgi:hypothetical protein
MHVTIYFIFFFFYQCTDVFEVGNKRMKLAVLAIFNVSHQYEQVFRWSEYVLEQVNLSQL